MKIPRAASAAFAFLLSFQLQASCITDLKAKADTGEFRKSLPRGMMAMDYALACRYTTDLDKTVNCLKAIRAELKKHGEELLGDPEQPAEPFALLCSGTLDPANAAECVKQVRKEGIRGSKVKRSQRILSPLTDLGLATVCAGQQTVGFAIQCLRETNYNFKKIEGFNQGLSTDLCSQPPTDPGRLKDEITFRESCVLTTKPHCGNANSLPVATRVIACRGREEALCCVQDLYPVFKGDERQEETVGYACAAGSAANDVKSCMSKTDSKLLLDPGDDEKDPDIISFIQQAKAQSCGGLKILNSKVAPEKDGTKPQ